MKLSVIFGALTVAGAMAAEKPNVVFILADDLGYGDVAAFNPEGKIATPHVDRLAKEGMRFTDAHSGSAVCTPTRYGVLTGRYAWRTRLKNGVLGGYSPHLIDVQRETVGSLLQQVGYHTACIGKWHLGMDWEKPGGEPENAPRNYGVEEVDYTAPIKNGPNRAGFDYFFGISASLDMPPYLYIENDRATEVPTTTKKWLRAGPAAESFEAEDVLPDITAKAVDYIRERGHDPARKPFFLYMPLNSPHTPIVPKEEFRGKTGLGAYGDFVYQTDWAVGEVLGALEDNGMTENTLVIFTSDNGCSPQAKFKDLAEKGHNPNHVFRGHKADIYEGGHRVPYVVRWPGVVAPGSECGATVCLTDLMATAGEIVGVEMPEGAATDSVSLLPLLKGGEGEVRDATVHHSINGSFAVRQGKWKLCVCPGSGGWSSPRPGKEPEGAPEVQLFDLEADIGERKNLASERPEVVAKLKAVLEAIKVAEDD